jgi:putative membrane protein
MLLESVLAYLHLAAVLGWLVFLTSQTALLRPAWCNPAAMLRLAVVARLAHLAAAATLVTGGLRMVLGIKGFGWYAAQPLMQAKLVLMLLMWGGAWTVSRQLTRWQRSVSLGGSMPGASALDWARRRMMWVTHLMVVPPLLGVLMARGLGVR